MYETLQTMYERRRRAGKQATPPRLFVAELERRQALSDDLGDWQYWQHFLNLIDGIGGKPVEYDYQAIRHSEYADLLNQYGGANFERRV